MALAAMTVAGHGQDEADDAAQYAAQGGDDEYHQGVDIKGPAHDFGLADGASGAVGPM
jgi:hypothetical protein